MSEKKEKKERKSLPMFLDMAMLLEHMVPWSEDTVHRKIKSAGFPAMQDEGGRYIFKKSDVLEWFKRREVKAG